MAFDEKTRALVRRYYVFEFLSLEQSASKAGVSFNTARRWKKEAEKKGDDWDKVRDVQVMAGNELTDITKGLLSGFIIQYRATMDEIQNSNLNAQDKVDRLSSLADSFAKMTAASKRILPEISAIATAMKTIELFANLIKTKKPHLLPDFIELLDEIKPLIDKEFK
ncbi:DUF1804 family protein [Pasteurella multocida]|uniref:DUF1804 family protein n=1 Tax=Pasteurella multocida TaxID=747 RepID=UPI00099A4947|nr:DUF1804 family protein [Pasteurella multocida]ARA69031.1 DNA-binding protein [Pasteurella multocida subsp. multocida]ARA69616.1 DNA-binding protein [Pasteurella multocida subsp. multocida]ARA70835.1 DNA-binding protein [Pasteurella multocida subsp. multocida]ARA88712.1 DNA-binding protein [Pasteurella multocida subsp. septica]ARA90197.1 DNA-binding protein [Pasteurella multocida subsp. septica]